jgi:hypothetical protein
MLFHTRQVRDLVKPQIQFGSTDIASKSEINFSDIRISEYMK